MIIKISDALAVALLGVTTGPGLVYWEGLPPTDDAKHLTPYVPDWMNQFLAEGGQMMMISREEYDDLDEEIRMDHVNVIKY